MHTVVETLKRHSVYELQQGDTWEVLSCQRIVLGSRGGPRVRGDAYHPLGADPGHSNRARQQ